MNVIDKFLEHYSYRFPKGYPDLNNHKDYNLINQILFEELNINLFERSLSYKELEKPYPSKNELSSLYNDRGSYFLYKINKGEEFELTDGSKIVIDPEASKEAIDILKSKNYSNLGGTKKIFIDTNGNSYNLSKFEKTIEFGSGSGSGGGSKNTDIQESTQCVVTAIAFKVVKGNITENNLTDENVDKAMPYCDITASTDDVKDFIKNQSWINSLVSTANILYDRYKGIDFEFHKGSNFVKSIYDSFKQASKEGGKNIESNKWNPSDIWLVSSEVKSIDFPSKLDELNGLILNLLLDESLVGISLKKLSGDASLSYYNVSKDDLKQYTFKGIKSSSKSKNSSLLYNDGVIMFRTFNFATNFAGEIQGKSAAQGKIGLGGINDILKLNNLPELPKAETLSKLFNDNDNELISDFNKIYSELVENISKDDFINLLENNDLNWKVSKYMSLKLCSLIKNSSEDTQTEVISDIIRYSSSSLKISSAFVKVS